MNPYSSILIFLFSVLSGLLVYSPTTSAQELQVRFEEQLVIGDQENAPVEYLFGGPRYIRTDSEYRIYVVTQNNSIRVFSPEGEYLKTIGRRGKGPGEFLTISSVTIGPNDELIVHDGHTRRVTWFYHFGDSIETRSMPSPYWLGDHVVPVAENRYATIAIEPSSVREYLANYVDIDFENVNDGDNILYLLDKDLSERSSGLLDVYRHFPFDPDNPLEARFAERRFQLSALDSTTLVVTNRISDGAFYLVDINSGAVRQVRGAFYGYESYEELDWDRRESYRGNRVGLVSSSSQFVYQVKLASQILLTNTRWGLHFTTIAEGNEGSYNIEFLDRNGTYLGFANLDDDFTTYRTEYNSFLGTETKTLQLYPMHLDDRDRLYYVDYSSGIPVVRVTKITLMED